MEYNIGDLRNGTPVLPKDKRKTILLLSDDLRISSGIATASKELAVGIIHRFNIIQLGAAVNHPERGKVLNLDADVSTHTGVKDAFLRIIPWAGYGDPTILRQLIMNYNPSAILHFTDPRYWRWLYDMASEIRETIPIMYYTIWDNVGAPEDRFAGDPKYNAEYYASCDSLFCISKQTYGMTTRVVTDKFGDELKIIHPTNNSK